MIGLLAFIYKVFEHFIQTEIPEVKSVDLFFNQFETQDDGESDAVMNPRILIEIEEFEPIQNLGRIQEWEGSVKLHVGIDINNTFFLQYEGKERNFQYLSLLDTIYKKLAYISSYNIVSNPEDGMYKLYQVERSIVKFSVDEGPIKVSEISFRFIAEDNSMQTSIYEDTIDIINEEIKINKYELPN